MVLAQVFLSLNDRFIVASDEEMLETARKIVGYTESGFDREQLAAWMVAKLEEK